jgi:hypothetical protein
MWLCSPTRAMAFSFTRFSRSHTRRATVGRTPLEEWSVRRRDLYLTTHNTHNRQTSMPPAGFEPAIAAGERQTVMLGCKQLRTSLPDHQTISVAVTNQSLCTQCHAATVCMHIVWWNMLYWVFGELIQWFLYKHRPKDVLWDTYVPRTLDVKNQEAFYLGSVNRGDVLRGTTQGTETLDIQGDKKVSVHLITVQKTRKNILNSLNHLPW